MCCCVRGIHIYKKTTQDLLQLTAPTEPPSRVCGINQALGIPSRIACTHTHTCTCVLIITIIMMILFQEHLSMHTTDMHPLTKVAVSCLKNILIIIIIIMTILFQECLSMHTDAHMQHLTEVAVSCLQNILRIKTIMMILFQEHL